MAKQQRVTHSRTVKKKSKQAVKVSAAPAPRRARAVVPVPGPSQAPSPAPAPPAKKPGYYEAIALYENGVRALQRHDFEAAAGHFRTVLDRYPDERELLERARLYLRVCERETARRPVGPQTMQERVYAATVALNSGDHAAALDHLRRALEQSPDSDHAHYIMAVALTMRGQPDDAMEHLRQAIALNPENRGLARQDPDLEGLRTHAGFSATLDGSVESARRRNRAGRR
jgi:tetratricopeptide (TPR) repeat protein